MVLSNNSELLKKLKAKQTNFKLFIHRLNAFLEGFYDIIPKRLISIFNEQELELLISGLPNIDIEDLRTNTEYHKYQATSIQVRNVLINLFVQKLSFNHINRFNGSGELCAASTKPSALSSSNLSQEHQKYRFKDLVLWKE